MYSLQQIPRGALEGTIVVISEASDVVDSPRSQHIIDLRIYTNRHVRLVIEARHLVGHTSFTWMIRRNKDMGVL